MIFIEARRGLLNLGNMVEINKPFPVPDPDEQEQLDFGTLSDAEVRRWVIEGIDIHKCVQVIFMGSREEALKLYDQLRSMLCK